MNGVNFIILFKGVYIESVFIKDMVLSKEFQTYLSMAPKARRIGESKIISAKVYFYINI